MSINLEKANGGASKSTNINNSNEEVVMNNDNRPRYLPYRTEFNEPLSSIAKMLDIFGENASSMEQDEESIFITRFVRQGRTELYACHLFAVDKNRFFDEERELLEEEPEPTHEEQFAVFLCDAGEVDDIHAFAKALNDLTWDRTWIAQRAIRKLFRDWKTLDDLRGSVDPDRQMEHLWKEEVNWG